MIPIINNNMRRKPYTDWEIRDFTQGYIDKIDNNELPNGALQDCRNVISRQIGKIRSRNGQAKLNSTEIDSGHGVHGLATFYLGTSKFLLVAVNGSLYYCNPPSGTMILLKSGLSATVPLMFVTALVDGKNQIMGFNGVDTPFKWDGSGTPQVTTATVVGTITATGNASVIVTADGMTGSPAALSVAVAADDTATIVAGKMRTAMEDDTGINAWFYIGGTGADIVLTRKAAAADDATMNVAIDNDTCAGLTADATSAATTAGVVAGISNMNDYRIVNREVPTTTDNTVYTLANKPVRSGADKLFVYSNNTLLDYETGYTLDATNGTITFASARVNTVSDLTSDDAQTVCYPLNGLVECLHPFVVGENVELYDKDGDLIYTFVDEETHAEGSGNYRADYANGLLYVPTSYSAYDVEVTTPETLTTGDHLFYAADHPFKEDTIPVVKDKDGVVLTPDAVIYGSGIVYFATSQAAVEPLTIDYTYAEITDGTLTTTDHKMYTAASAFKISTDVIVHDKDGNILEPTAKSYVNGYVYFSTVQTVKEPLTIDYTSYTGIAVTGETISSVNHTCYIAAHPFKAGVVPVIKDTLGNVLAPDSVNYAGGLIQFAASQETVEPLTATYTWVNDALSGDLGTLMPLTVKYKWVDMVKVDYQYSNGAISSAFRYPVTWKGRIFAMAGDDYIYWSDITENGSEYEAWPPINNWGVNQGKGETDGCLLVLQNELYIFKNRSIHRFRGSSLDDYNLTPVVGGVGCAGPRAACLDSDSELIYFISEQGLYQFDGLTATNISRGRIPILWDTVNISALNQSVVKSWHGLVLFSLPISASTTNNFVLVFDPANPAFWPWDGMTLACYGEISTTSGTKLYAGLTTTGYVAEQDTGDDDMGSNIDSWFKLPSIDVGAADKMKKAKYIYVEHGEDQTTWADVYASKDNATSVQLTAKNADGALRKYAIRPTITGKWRYLELMLKHDQAGAFEIRSVKVPCRIKPKSSVKGDI